MSEKGAETAKPYDALGIIYDALGHHDTIAWGKYLSALLRDMGAKSGGRIIDAACGTGGISMELVKAGYSVTGIDISQQMLTEAAGKAARAGAPVTFVRQDIRKMRVHRPADGVICACDGVNYLLTRKDLMDFLKCARLGLTRGGPLLFDVSSEEKLLAMDGQLYGEETDDSAYLWTNSVDNATRVISMDITLFIKQWEFYRREHEVHRQRIWGRDELLDALRESGFEPAGVWAAFTRDEPGAGCARIQFAARAV